MKKKTISAAIVTLATAALIFAGSFISQLDEGNITNITAPANTVSQQSNEDKTLPGSTGKTDLIPDAKLHFPENLLEVGEEGIVPFGHIEAEVTKVTDGDTFHIKYKKEDYKVRMLDIDTPESVKAGVKPQPYSKEASELTSKMLSGKRVKLIFEKGTKDQFDRLLAHVILEDETYYNAYMVKNGYAICVFYSPNTLMKEYFTELQDVAINAKEGFWKLPVKERPFVKDSKGKYIAAYKSKDKAA